MGLLHSYTSCQDGPRMQSPDHLLFFRVEFVVNSLKDKVMPSSLSKSRLAFFAWCENSGFPKFNVP